MYFWKIEELKKDLISNKVSQRDLLFYLLLDTVLTVGAVEIAGYLPAESFNLWDYIDSVVGTLITTFGTVWVYKSNGGNLGTRLVERYLAIGWVILVRYMTLLVPIFMLMYMLDADNFNETKWWHVLIIETWYLGYFWRFAKHTKDVAYAT
jgi:hypothetical protein